MEVDTNADAVKTILNESSLWCELSTFQLTLFSTFDWYKKISLNPNSTFLISLMYYIDINIRLESTEKREIAWQFGVPSATACLL